MQSEPEEEEVVIIPEKCSAIYIIIDCVECTHCSTALFTHWIINTNRMKCQVHAETFFVEGRETTRLHGNQLHLKGHSTYFRIFFHLTPSRRATWWQVHLWRKRKTLLQGQLFPPCDPRTHCFSHSSWVFDEGCLCRCPLISKKYFAGFLCPIWNSYHSDITSNGCDWSVPQLLFRSSRNVFLSFPFLPEVIAGIV